MGYESRLFVVKKYEALYDEEMRWAEIISMFNMCKCPTTYKLKDSNETDCFIYYNDERVVEDKYGDRLTEEKIEVVIELLEKDIANGEDYRRLFPLLASLKSFKEQQDMGIWDSNLVVLHYGY